MNALFGFLDNFSRISLRAILGGVLAFPLLSAWLYFANSSGETIFPVGHSFWENLLFLTLNKLDSGGQMALGPNLLRFALLLGGIIVCAIPRPLDPAWRRPLLALFCFHAISFVSAFQCSHRFDALFCSVDAVVVSLMIWLPSTQWLPSDIPRLAGMFAAVGLLTIPTNFTQMTLQAAVDGQMRGSFFHPTMMATYLMLGLPPLLAFCFSRSTLGSFDAKAAQRLRYAFILLSAASLACVVLSSSRAAYIAAAVSLTLFFSCLSRLEKGTLSKSGALLRLLLALSLVAGLALLLHARVAPSSAALVLVLAWLLPNWKNRLKYALLIGAIALFVVTAQWEAQQAHSDSPVASRVESLAGGGDNSSVARVTFWKAALGMAHDYPWLGVGPEGFHRYYPQYQDDVRWFSKFVHSTPLAVLCETGVFGLLSFTLAALFLLALAVRRLVEEKDPGIRVVRFGLLMGCLSFSMCTFVDVQFQFPILPLSFAFCLGLALIGEPPETLALSPERNPWSLRPSIVLQQAFAGLLLIAWATNLFTIPADYYMMVSRMAGQRGRHEEGALLAQEACRLSPFQGEYYHQLGLELVANYSKLDDKQKKLLRWAGERAVALDSHRAVHYDLMAKVQMADKHPDQALGFAQRAIECDPMNYANFYFILSQIYGSLGRFDDARDVLRTCVARFPRDSFAVMFDFRSKALNQQLAEVLLSLGEMEDPSAHPVEAEPYYRESIELNPEQFWAHLGLALALFQQKRYPEAKPALLKALVLSPRAEVALNLLIYCNDATGNVTQVRELQERLRTAKAENAKEAQKLAPPESNDTKK